jgi:hypothetical protein
MIEGRQPGAGIWQTRHASRGDADIVLSPGRARERARRIPLRPNQCEIQCVG